MNLGKAGKKKGVIRPKYFPAMFRGSAKPSTRKPDISELVPRSPCSYCALRGLSHPAQSFASPKTLGNSPKAPEEGVICVPFPGRKAEAQGQ